MEHLGKPIYSEYNNNEFLEILDDHGRTHTAIHESARRIRLLLARITALETAGRELVAATNYDQERRRNIPSVIYKHIMNFAALLGETK